MLLPQRGTRDREKFDKAYNSWKPKPKPANYTPLNKQEKKHLNACASTGFKQAIHDLMNDQVWRKEIEEKQAQEADNAV